MINSNSGAVLKMQDLGWRNTAYPVSKPRVGVFHSGKWFSLRYGASPKAMPELQGVFNHCQGVLRHHTEKTQFSEYMPRGSYYPAPAPGGGSGAARRGAAG